MNTALFFLLACALMGLYSSLGTRRAYLISLIGAGIIAGFFFNFGSLMR